MYTSAGPVDGIPKPKVGPGDESSDDITASSDPSGDERDLAARRYHAFAKKVDDLAKRKRALRRKHSSSSGSSGERGSEGSSGSKGKEPDKKEKDKGPHGHVGPDEIVTWHLPDGQGTIKLEKARKRFGAHCPLGGVEIIGGVRVPRAHGPGPCRLNRVAAKHPLGLLGAWCVVADDYLDARSHYEAWMEVEANLPCRVAARGVLRFVDNFEALVEAEGGGNVEPARVP